MQPPAALKKIRRMYDEVNKKFETNKDKTRFEQKQPFSGQRIQKEGKEEKTMLQVEQINTSEMMRILAAARNHPTGRGTSSFEQMRQTELEKLSQEHDAEWFRNRFQENLEAIRFDRSVVNGAVDITAEGLQAMNSDRTYCDQVMTLIRHEFSSSYTPRSVSIKISVGATLDEYRVDTWSAADEEEFREVTAGSFYRRIGHNAASSAASFAQGLLWQFREKLQAARAQSEHAAPAAAAAVGLAARRYAADAMAYGSYQAYAAQAFEG